MRGTPQARCPGAVLATTHGHAGVVVHETDRVDPLLSTGCYPVAVDWPDFRRNASDFFRGAAYGTYEREMRRQALELNDLFMLLCYLELMGVPNPASLYMLDMYPLLLDEFHLWHRRMGITHSPLDSMGCC